jgi:ABC-type transport system involved in cytochrome bd biosynthesis fused ATPase/permease subunit
MQSLQAQLSQTQKFSTQLTNSSNEKEEQIKLYREKDEMVKQLREKEKSRDILLRKRERELSMKRYYFRVGWPWIVFVAAVGAIVYLFYTSQATAAIVVTICTFVLRLIGHNLFNSRQIKHEEQKKQEEIWDSSHSELGDLNGEIERIEEDIRQITKRIECV